MRRCDLQISVTLSRGFDCMLLGRHDSKRAGQCNHRPLRGHAKLRADQRSVRYLKTSAGAGVQTASCWWPGVIKSAEPFLVVLRPRRRSDRMKPDVCFWHKANDGRCLLTRPLWGSRWTSCPGLHSKGYTDVVNSADGSRVITASSDISQVWDNRLSERLGQQVAYVFG